MKLAIVGLGSVEVPDAIGAAICGGDTTVADALASSLGVKSSDVVSAFALVCPKDPNGGGGLPAPAPAVPRWVWVAGGGALLWLLWSRK